MSIRIIEHVCLSRECRPIRHRFIQVETHGWGPWRREIREDLTPLCEAVAPNIAMIERGLRMFTLAINELPERICSELLGNISEA